MVLLVYLNIVGTVDIYVITSYNKIDIHVYFIIGGELCPKLVINIWKNVR